MKQKDFEKDFEKMMRPFISFDDWWLREGQHNHFKMEKRTQKILL